MIGKLPMCYLCDITHNTQPTVSSMYKRGPTDYEFVGLPGGADHQPGIQAYAQHTLSHGGSQGAYALVLAPAPWGGAGGLSRLHGWRELPPTKESSPYREVCVLNNDRGIAPSQARKDILRATPLPCFSKSFSCTDHIAVPRNHRASDIPGGPIARLHGVMDKTRCGKSRLSSKPAPQPPCIKLTTGITGSK